MSYEKQTSIDKPQCPKCKGSMELTKSWEVKGRGRGHKLSGFRIKRYTCPKCGISTNIPTGIVEAKKRPKEATKQ